MATPIVIEGYRVVDDYTQPRVAKQKWIFVYADDPDSSFSGWEVHEWSERDQDWHATYSTDPPGELTPVFQHPESAQKHLREHLEMKIATYRKSIETAEAMLDSAS